MSIKCYNGNITRLDKGAYIVAVQEAAKSIFSEYNRVSFQINIK